MAESNEISILLQRLRAGDESCRAQIIHAAYGELKRLAAAKLRFERKDHSLQPSALVNEAYLRLADGEAVWQNRAHFFGVAAGVMRNILVDHARARKARKRDGGQRVELDFAGAIPAVDLDHIIPLDFALRELEKANKRHFEVVQMRYFGGLTYEEIAEVLHVASRTVKRDWEYARAWLQVRIQGGVDESGDDDTG